VEKGGLSTTNKKKPFGFPPNYLSIRAGLKNT
jgi:hypothetical protein